MESVNISYNINAGFTKVPYFSQTSLNEFDVVVKPMFTGICGSDLYLMHQMNSLKLKNLILGHEWIGQVIDKGSQVKLFNLGDIVTGTGHLSCGQCNYCKENLTNLCEKTKHFSSNEIGSLATKIIVDEFNLVKISASSEKKINSNWALYEVLSVAEEALLTCESNMFNLNSEVLILGAGPIGLAIAFVFKNKGYKVRLMELDSFRVAHAKHNDFECDLLQTELILQQNKNKFSTIIDCSNDYNNKSGGFKFINYFSKKSYDLLLVGKYLNPLQITEKFYSKYIKMLFLRGTSKKTLVYTIEKWKNKIDQIGHLLITHKFDVNEIDKAFDIALSQKNCIKILLDTSFF